MDIYRGDSDDDGDERGSPMDISRGTATPQSGPAPWITDEQVIVPEGGEGGKRVKPEWMTGSQEFSPPPREAKRALFQEEETQQAPTTPLLSPPSNVVVVEQGRYASGAKKKLFEEKDFNLHTAPWGAVAPRDVDFVCLAREQAEAAVRQGMPGPSDKFIAVTEEHPVPSGRLERVLHNMLSRNPTAPVVVLYAAEPESDPSKRPVILWRSSPGRSKSVLHLLVGNQETRKQLNGRLVISGPASIGTARVDLFDDEKGHEEEVVHVRLRYTDELLWQLEPGWSLPSEAVVVILIQEDTYSQPQALELQPLRFDQARIEGTEQG